MCSTYIAFFIRWYCIGVKSYTSLSFGISISPPACAPVLRLTPITIFFYNIKQLFLVLCCLMYIAAILLLFIFYSKYSTCTEYIIFTKCIYNKFMRLVLIFAAYVNVNIGTFSPLNPKNV